MRLSAHVNYYLKDLPKDYVGMTRESWNFGKDHPITLYNLVAGFANKAIEFYCRFASAEDLQAATDALANYFKGFEFTDSEDEEE